ncbi:MAG: hypothetical protein BWY64_03637 [bacterium ADurb.Bin363]|nr:MAG: hypothetical protein BWY64_03637 [bacterium ADurb.Bin363]
MSNYTLKEVKTSNLPGHIKNDGKKGNLKNFVELPGLEFKKLSENKEKEENKKKFIEKVVLSLILLCHSPLRGVKEFLEIIFDYKMSLGERCDKFPERNGKTRLELLTGKKHPDWLQLLGY